MARLSRRLWERMSLKTAAKEATSPSMQFNYFSLYLLFFDSTYLYRNFFFLWQINNNNNIFQNVFSFPFSHYFLVFLSLL